MNMHLLVTFILHIRLSTLMVCSKKKGVTTSVPLHLENGNTIMNMAI